MIKKIMITGLPHSGKTTLLERILAGIPNKRGFLTREIRERGERTGFELITSGGETRTLASVNIHSSFKVSKYGVDVLGFEKTLPQFFKHDDQQLLYLDEIGQMELFSTKFKDLVLDYLNSPNVFVATISKVFQDDFIRSITQRQDVAVFELTPQNREQVFEKVREKLFAE